MNLPRVIGPGRTSQSPISSTDSPDRSSSKLACVINIIIMSGMGMIDCLIGSQIPSAISRGSINMIVGITINVVIISVVATFWMKVFGCMCRQQIRIWVLVWFLTYADTIFIGSAGSKFDILYSSIGDPETINDNWASFFSLCLSALGS